MKEKKIQTALISAWSKNGLDEIAAEFQKQKVKIYSTGGTAEFLRKLGHTVEDVAGLTGFPSIFGGRVKTLHPKIFGGILAQTESEEHRKQADQYEIPFFDCVIVDLYPFEKTAASGASVEEIIEKIDIGGISLIRAAAKNFRDVAVVAAEEKFREFAQVLKRQNCSTNIDQRKELATFAFDISSHYDTRIYQWMTSNPEKGSAESLNLNSFKISERNPTALRYGENPEQKAWFCGDLAKKFTQLQGKELSYNNLIDIDSALSLIDEFAEPCFAIIKHNNPCGLASGTNIIDAWNRALECDPLSAFGGILAANREIDETIAKDLAELFFEVMIAPSFSQKALEIFSGKKGRRILRRIESKPSNFTARTLLGGVLIQEADTRLTTAESWNAKTKRQPTTAEIPDILFGEKAVKHLKSNAIAIVRDGQMIGSGMGQTSRIDALKQAINKAKERGFELKGSVLASDAFFPFEDCAKLAHEHGIGVLVQPGGSLRDEDTINYCESQDICLIFTGLRHFRH